MSVNAGDGDLDGDSGRQQDDLGHVSERAGEHDGHHHDHGLRGHGSALAGSARHRRPLAIAFSLTAAFMLVEFTVGLTTGSLALLADAAHMGTDVVGLGLALAAAILASRPPTAARTYGLYRIEVLAALANGALLFLVAGGVLIEAIGRFAEPPDIPGVPLLITAVAGLAINLVSAWLLSVGKNESIGVRGAYLEVIADAAGSIAVIIGAVIILTTGWTAVDPILAVLLGVVILPRTVALIRQAVRILLEVAPKGIDVPALHRELCALPGVAAVHDLHVWTITEGLNAASGHVVLEPGAGHATVLTSVRTRLRENYGIEHATIQCEPCDFDDEEAGVC